VISIRNITKRFGDRAVLDGISLDVAAGEILFIIGKSGTGKSVLLKNIVGLMRPDAGEIWVNGEEISRFSERDYLKVRRKCGLVFQSPALLDSLSVAENVAFGLRAHRVYETESGVQERVTEVLRSVGLNTKVKVRLPGELSFGMQKRVSLARSLALAPEYLLYDEPTTGLDPVAMRSINELIRTLARDLNVTSVVVSHDMPCALDIADRIVCLDGGKVAEIGTPHEIRQSSHPVVQAFLRASFGESSG
jgi:phospholipid/cholesterol/gamma-HCH transport system ATP-binding protein